MDREIKYCAYCGTELSTEKRHNTYCSQNCANAAKRKIKIDAWLNGDFDGMRKGGVLSQTIRNYILEKANYQCELCGWHETNSTTGKIPLEIHHIDGDYENNRPENLQVLCPNCHSLTPNFKALNKSERERTQVRKDKKEYFCVDCGKSIGKGSIRCQQCEAKTRITEKPLSREELKKLIRTTPFTTIAKSVGVSDNAIRKWCQQYGLPSKKRDIKEYTDEEWEKI